MTERFNLRGMGLATRIAVAAGVVGLLSILALTWFIYRGSEEILFQRDTEQLATSVEVSAVRLRSRIEFARQDTLLLTKTPPVAGTFRAMANGGVDPADGSTARLWRDRLATIFAGMLEARPEYVQVRLIGVENGGQEIVRVDRQRDGAIRRTPEEALQVKIDRPYVQETRKLGRGEIYLSPIDLNRENGQIEVPHLAVIRAATPVVSDNGETLGMVVINVDMGKILQIVRGPARQHAAYFVTNQNGDYLAHPDANRTFGFDLGKSFKLQEEFPETKRFMEGGSQRFSGLVSTPDGRQLAVATKVDYDPRDASQFAIVGEIMPSDALESSLVTVRNRALVAAGVVLLIGLAAMAWFTRTLSRPLRQIADTAVAVAGGERSVDIGEIASRSDEVGVLARSFETMVEKVEAHERELREAEARTSRVIDVMPEAIVVTDRNGIIRRVNERATAIFGYEQKDLLGQPVELLIPQRYHGSHAGHREAYAAHPEIRPMGAGRDLYGRCKDGSEVPVEIALAPLNDGAVDGQIVVSIADITRRKVGQDMLRESNEKLARSNQELMQFAYVASHDLQEPLRMVDSYMGLIERRYKGKLDADADEFIGFAVDGARRMKRLINDLLTYSRVSNRPLKVKPIDLRAEVDAVLALFQDQIEQSGATVEIGPLPRIEGDPGQIERLFTNLIGNALKFRSDKTPHVRIEAEQRGKLWEFTISDNGIGIDPDFNEKVFEIFSRLHSREQYEGTGIGLAACKRIVELHGGLIWVEPGQNGGSVFRFTLPERQQEEAA